MNNDKIVEGIEARVDALTEEILMFFVMEGMEAKNRVKQLLMQFAIDARTAIH